MVAPDAFSVSALVQMLFPLTFTSAPAPPMPVPVTANVLPAGIVMNPCTPSAAPLATLRLAVDPKAALFARVNCPAETVVDPLNVLLPASTQFPVPALLTTSVPPPVPLQRIPLICPLPAPIR